MDNIVLLATLIITIISIATACFQVVSHLLKGVREELEFRESMITIFPTLEEIVSHFRPNGGNSLRDVIDRIEIKLKLQEQRQRVLVCELKIGYWEADKNGYYIWVSDRCGQLMGLQQADAIGTQWISAVHPEDRERVWDDWCQSVQHGYAFRSTHRFIHYDGTIIPVNVEGTVLYKESEIIGFAGSVQIAE